METIRRLVFMALLVTVVSVCTACACGRTYTDDPSATTAPEASRTIENTVEQTVPSTDPVEEDRTVVPQETDREGNHMDNHGETGGVLEDMMDDVEKGMNEITDDIMGGPVATTGHP